MVRTVVVVVILLVFVVGLGSSSTKERIFHSFKVFLFYHTMHDKKKIHKCEKYSIQLPALQIDIKVHFL